MPTPDAFAEVERLQDAIRQVILELAKAVTAVTGLTDVPALTQQRLIDREVNQARDRLRPLRLQERLLLDQVAAEAEARARTNGVPLWAESLRRSQSGDPRRPNLVREALLIETVKANAYVALAEAPPRVLLHRLRAALRADDHVTAAAIEDLALRHLMATGRPCEPDDATADMPPARRHLLTDALGMTYATDDPDLGGLLDALAAFEEARLSPEGRQARRLVAAGVHVRKPLDLAVWAAGDPLLRAVVERMGDA
jgi:hypothetical protein